MFSIKVSNIRLFNEFDEYSKHCLPLLLMIIGMLRLLNYAPRF